MNLYTIFDIHDKGEGKMMLPMTSPPLDTISSGQRPFEMDYANHSWDLDRKRRLEHQLFSIEKCVRGVVPYHTPTLDPGHENDSTYHYLSGGPFGKSAGSFLSGNAIVPSDFEYPSPFGVPIADLSSISESERSPSPQALGRYGFSNIRTIDFDGDDSSYPRIYEGDATCYKSVNPGDVQNVVHEMTYPEPHQKVSQPYGPCASLCLTQEETQYEIPHDDVDADGEPDLMCDRDVDSGPAHRESKMAPKTKKNPRARTHQTSTGGQTSGVRKRAASRKVSQGSKTNKPALKETTAEGRTYACSFRMYGCQSTFSSKNEWKRHFSSQHLKLSFYRCDLEGCHPSTTKGPNDFNRKDLFTQHLRRMHAPWSSSKTNPTREEKAKFDGGLDEHHKRCLQKQRSPPPLSQCTICEQVFRNWHGRMEHMSKHYEENTGFEEPEDPELVKWALQEGILCRKDASSNELGLADKRDRDNRTFS